MEIKGKLDTSPCAEATRSILSNGVLGATKIAIGSISSDRIIDGAISAEKIRAGSVTPVVLGELNAPVVLNRLKSTTALNQRKDD